MTLIDRSGPQEKWGFGALSVLEFVRLGGKGFLVAGSAGGGSLIVYSVDAAGKIAPVDQLLDTGQTRFDGIQALTGFTTAGRAFLLAGGADDGLTLLQLGAYGKLSVLAVLEDDWDTTLGNVSAIEVVRNGSAIKVIVGGSAEGGFSIFSLDLGQLGKVLKGTVSADILTGTEANDDLYGNDGNDQLNGSAGDDRIADGTGTDKLTGGPGADIFDFADDGRTDTILDFEPGIDRIDLSAFALLYDVSEVAITVRDYGYDIRVGDDLMVLRTAGGSPDAPYVFGPHDFIFG